MAKVKPGPVVSSVSGSVGPVTYYEHLGRTIVRARVRPHQKISSARYWNRQAWKDVMRWWRIFRPLSSREWRYHAANRMHGVNLFVQRNRPVETLPLYYWPPLEMLWPDMLCMKTDLGDRWRITFFWMGNLWEPWTRLGFAFQAADGYNEGLYIVNVTDPYWVRDCYKLDGSAWYVMLNMAWGEPNRYTGGQVHRFMVDDMPLW